MKKKTVYEQPLNDRIRNLLRLEHLFSEMMYRLKGPSEWDNRAVINILVEIVDMGGRVDYKEVTKDLEHHHQTLQRWQHTPHVDKDRLVLLLGKIDTLLGKMEHLEELSFSNHQVINLVRQRQTVIGGTCRSDLPAYYHFLQKNPKQRQNELMEWIVPLSTLREAVEMDLYMIRNNALTTQETANNGFFQTKLEAHVSYQLIQVGLALEHPCYPEINGGKQRISIRFFEPLGVKERPLQTEQDVHFELCCCTL